MYIWNFLIIWRVLLIWYEVISKLRVSFYGLVSKKEVFYESNNHIETHIDVVVEVLEFHSSVSFDFWLEKEFIEFWLFDIIFESPVVTNFCWVFTVKLWSPLFSWYHSGRVLRFWWILLGWQGFLHVNMIHHLCDGWYDHFFEIFFEIHHFLIRVLIFELNCGLHDYELVIRPVIYIIDSFYNIKAWGMKSTIT